MLSEIMINVKYMLSKPNHLFRLKVKFLVQLRQRKCCGPVRFCVVRSIIWSAGPHSNWYFCLNSYIAISTRITLLLHISGKFLSSFIAFGFLPNFVVKSHAFIDFQNLTTLFSHVQINVHAYVRHNFFRLKFYPVERI